MNIVVSRKVEKNWHPSPEEHISGFKLIDKIGYIKYKNRYKTQNTSDINQKLNQESIQAIFQSFFSNRKIFPVNDAFQMEKSSV